MSQAGQQYITLQPISDLLYGERIVLRPYQRQDAAAFQAAIAESRAHLRPWEWFGDAFHTIEQTEDWIIRRQVAWMLRDSFTYGIWEQASGRLLGNIELMAKAWRVPWFMLAYWIRQSEAGQGYVAEAVRVLTDYAFDNLGAQRVELGIDAKNQRSIAVAERLGFHLDGRLRNTEVGADGELLDQLWYSLTPADPRWSNGARLTIAEWDEHHPDWSQLLPVIEPLGQQEWVNARFPWHRTSHLLVATKSRTVLGFLRFVTQEIGADDELPPTLLGGKALREGKVLAFGVAEPYRRQGIGRALQEAALRLAEQLGCYQLRSHSSGSNTANHQLKLTMGFALQRVMRGADQQGAYFVMPLPQKGAELNYHD